MAALPVDLAGAVGDQPELKEALEKSTAALRQLAAVETSIRNLDHSVTGLGGQVEQLGLNTHPNALRVFADETGGHLWVHGRSLILLASGCMAGLLVLHALLRRWSNRPSAP